MSSALLTPLSPILLHLVTSVWLINKAGGLAYFWSRPLKGLDSELLGAGSNALNEQSTVRTDRTLSSNDLLVMASTLQSVHAISARVTPPSLGSGGGVQRLDWVSSDGSGSCVQVHCLQCRTGLKVVLTSALSEEQEAQLCKAVPFGSDFEAVLWRIYEIYTDWVLKNPFHTPEMPVRCDLFELKINSLFLGSK